MARIDLESRMTIKTLHARGIPNTAIARSLGVSEGTVRYQLRRLASGAVDGRAQQRRAAADYADAIAAWHASQGDGPINLGELYEHLVTEHGYAGSARSVQRYYREAFPPPPRRARRRVETPPGAQAQADWAVFPSLWLGGRRRQLYALHLTLSHSRADAVVWSLAKDQLGWLSAHNGAFARLGGVPATVRVDNEKTAVARGAGVWGVINPVYARYAQTLRFHIDPCPPRSPQHKGKVERRIRDQRLRDDPARRHWRDLAELQRWTDERLAASWQRRICPATGRSVRESWRTERRWLGPLPPVLPEPFDVLVTRRVRTDCTVPFEGRQYSVPFTHVGRTVEIRGCAGRVQIFAEAELVAVHPRRTERRLVLDPAHYDGEASAAVRAPTPLGRLGERLQQIAAQIPEERPVDLYAALAEVSR